MAKKSAKVSLDFLKHSHLAAFIFFVLASLLFVWPVLKNPGTISSAGGEEKLLSYLMNWDIYALSHNESRLIKPPFLHDYDYSLAFSDYLVGAAILAWPVTLITQEPFAVFQMAVFLAFLLNGFFVYLLVHKMTNDWWWGILAGVLFSFSTARLDSVGHVQVLSSYFIPLGLYFLARYSGDFRWYWPIGVGFMFFFQAITTVFLAYVFGFLLCLTFLSWWRTKTVSLKQFAVAISGILPGLILSGIAYIPYLRVSQIHKYSRSIDDAWGGSMYFLEYFYPTGNSRLRPLAEMILMKTPWPGYLGFAVSGLLVISIVILFFKRRRWQLSWFEYFGLGTVVVGFLMSLGPYLQFGKHIHSPIGKIPMPYLFFFHVLPGFNGMRTPQRWNHVLLFGASLLIPMLLSRLALTYSRKKLVVLILIFLVLGEAQLPLFTRPVPGSSALPNSYQQLSILESGVVLELPSQTWSMPLLSEEIDRLHWQSYMFSSNMRWFNGYSGYSPGSFMLTNDRLNRFTLDEDFNLALKDIRANYILLHMDQWDLLYKQGFALREASHIRSLLDDHPLYQLYWERDSEVIYVRTGNWF